MKDHLGLRNRIPWEAQLRFISDHILLRDRKLCLVRELLWRMLVSAMMMMMVVMIVFGCLTGCGESSQHNRTSPMNGLSDRRLFGANKVPSGHRVVGIGGCLEENGIRLAGPSHAGSQVQFGGREVIGRTGKPITVGEYEAILRKCSFIGAPRKLNK